MKEKYLHVAVCKYLRYQYVGVLFNSDLAGATKLTIGQARAMKTLRSNRGWPDLFIAEPRHGYHGLFVELKADRVKLYKVKDGSPATPHIAEQADMILELDKRGYAVGFAVGFDEAKKIIDNYLK